MNEVTCEVLRCPDEVEARDMCRMHYQRWYRHGDPLALMRPPESGGIYRINGPEGRVYIGSSDNVRRRWKSHKSYLRRCEHHNDALQIDWLDHGEAAFTFALLEEIADTSLLIEAEQRTLDAAIAAGIAVYNYAMDCRSPGRGIPHTDEAKAKMSAKARAWLDDPENVERVRLRALGDGNPMAKLDPAGVLAICDRLLAGEHPAKVAESLGVVQETVYQIRSGRTWKHVVPAETVAAMMAIRQNPQANRDVTEQAREHMAAVGRSNKGRKLSAERVQQISDNSRGAGNPKAKLDEPRVREIKRRMAAGAADIGEQNEELAAEFGVSASSIIKIRYGSTWSHVTV